MPTEIYSFANLTDNLIYTYDTGASAWGTGTTPIKSVLYVDDNTGYIYRYSGTVLVALTSGNPTWGTITGTLSDQTDLWAALSARPTSDTSTTTGNLAMYSNNTGTAIGDSAIIAANVVTTTSNFASNQLVVGRGNNKSLMALASGSEGQVLKMVSGIPAWGTEYSYTLPATSTTALGGVRLGYDASGNASYLPLVTDTGNKAYVALTLASINTVKPNIVTGSGLTSGYLVLGNGGNGVAVSTISATNVVTASGTLTSGTLLVGAGEKAVAASSYSVVTSISSASTDTNIPSAKAVYTYVDSQALTWETF